MSPTVLFAGPADRWARWRGPLEAALAQAVPAARVTAEAPPAAADYLVLGGLSAVDDFAPYARARAVLSTWAGVEGILARPNLAAPLARMVDPGLTQGMVEWVLGHVLRHHLGLDAHVANPEHRWEPAAPPLAPDRRVGVLGLGELGAACARAAAGLGFDVAGWSRGPKALEGVAAHHGEDGLAAVLGRSEILVLLLPLTPETEGVMDAARLALLPPGAVLLNPGRGGLVDDAALLAALGGPLAHATLDTFREEPLPRDHPFWSHPRVTVTPHIASATRPETAAAVIAENVRRGEAGEPLLHVVDRERGY